MIGFVIELPIARKISALMDVFVKMPQIATHIKNDQFEYYSWGDPIEPADLGDCLQKEPKISKIIDNVRGHFYYLLLSRKSGDIVMGNSLFSILPVYYSSEGDSLVLSENAIRLNEYSRKRSISRRFILETVLFNYPVFDQGPFEGIKLLPCNSSISVSGGKWRIEKHTRIEDHMAGRPASWRGSLEMMSDAFLKEAGHFLPGAHYFTSLTGGFDGRTLVAAGLSLKRNFSCYSFGSSSSRDVEIARGLCQAAGVEFVHVNLDDSYRRDVSRECGLEFIRNASGTATFARAHYLHAAKTLAHKAEYIVTGNFGSEVLRAAHVPGAVISPNLSRLFSATALEDGIRSIEACDEFEYLNRESFKDEWGELQGDLTRLPCFCSEYGSLSKNQQFYMFVFEEIFRKYFGAEMVNQFLYIKNRTPFLGWDFVKAILQTRLAGVHSNYFERNPMKRFKGQVLYADIIHKAYPAFGCMLTDKGYRPDDLFTIKGKLRILGGYLKNAKGRNWAAASDPYSVHAAFGINKKHFAKLKISPDIFNVDRIMRELDANETNESLFKPLSLSYLKELAET